MSLKSRWWRPTIVTALVLVGCQATPAPLQSGQAAAPTTAEGYQLLNASTSECGPLADLITTTDLTRTVYYPDCTTTITPADVATGVLADCGLALRLFDPGTETWVTSLTLGVGAHTVRVAYTYNGLPINCGETARVTVNSGITCNVNPPTELWPPNHDYSPVFNINTFASAHSCNGPLNLEIVSISSDEPEELHPRLDNNDLWNGDGRTFDDIVILSATTFKVRQERAGSGDGRVYTVVFKTAGETNPANYYTCYIQVPHDQSGRAAVDSSGLGRGYTVTWP